MNNIEPHLDAQPSQRRDILHPQVEHLIDGLGLTVLNQPVARNKSLQLQLPSNSAPCSPASLSGAAEQWSSFTSKVDATAARHRSCFPPKRGGRRRAEPGARLTRLTPGRELKEAGPMTAILVLRAPHLLRLAGAAWWHEWAFTARRQRRYAQLERWTCGCVLEPIPEELL